MFNRVCVSEGVMPNSTRPWSGYMRRTFFITAERWRGHLLSFTSRKEERQESHPRRPFFLSSRGRRSHAEMVFQSGSMRVHHGAIQSSPKIEAI
ncbi:hypothetical protein J2129_002028 [Methanofollis sp. W23]|nr:hypothetical protein [Methanofollis sp. W23]